MTGSTVRVSIREVREYAYRALLAAGASAGEAAHAADLVLHAELYDAAGLTGVVEDLARGPWGRAGLRAVPRDGARPAVEAVCGARSGELRVGPLVLDLAAGTPGVPVLVPPALLPVTVLLDAALLDAAAAAGSTVIVAAPAEADRLVVRVATGAGDLGHGQVERLALPGVASLAGSSWAVVTTGRDLTPAAAESLSWCGPESRRERRRIAAARGLQVDAAVWSVVAEHALLFLVPEAGA